MIDIKWSKLYGRIDDFEEAFCPSIITYLYSPITFDSKCYEDGKCETITTSWRKRLYINLWILELRFSWEKKL